MNYLDDRKIGKLLDNLKKLCFQTIHVMPVLFREGKLDTALASELTPFDTERVWGELDCDVWFRTELEVTPELAGQSIWVRFTNGCEKGWYATNPQSLAYLNGKVVCGLDNEHRDLLLTENAVAGQRYVIDLDTWSGLAQCDGAGMHFKAEALSLCRPVWKLYYDLKVPFDVAELLPKDDYRKITIYKHLLAAANLIDMREIPSQEFLSTVNNAIDYMAVEFYEKACNDDEAVAYCIGHTHLDVAWQWQYKHTRRKAARSFATALNLMEQYPDYMFMSSQPQLYDFIKEDHPEIFEGIAHRIEDGRWNAEGGMWVEADCNLTSGESLVRQFMYGKAFFKTQFNKDNKILWLPDVFGYSAALPQICKKCGIDYFMTTKLSWNEYNQIPADSFYWEGIDGTKILTHFEPVRDYVQNKDGDSSFYTTYNAFLNPNQIMGGWQRYSQKDLNNYFIASYGFGDGGGGTTVEMLENFSRMEKGIPGCPKTINASPLEFFERLKADTENNPRMPKWVGELYFEYHRGTYTSVAKNKKNNRKAELLLQKAEVLSTIAGTYPSNELHNAWKSVLLNQFHDVLPGSSIKEVYDDTDAIYKEVFDSANGICDLAVSTHTASIKRKGNSFIVYNVLGHERSEYVKTDWPQGIGEFHIIAPDGSKSAVQKTYDGKALFYASGVPAMGCAVYELAEGAYVPECTLTASTSSVSNGIITMGFDQVGRIVSLFDKPNDRELVPDMKTLNVLETYEDRPHEYDAWELSVYHKDKPYAVDAPCEFSIVETGVNRVVYKTVTKYLKSEITQYICIYANSVQVDFETVVDWKEENIILKTAFPADVHTNYATFEIQFGSVTRPTHLNTSWDFARFESCAHKWVDLSESGYGVSLLNDCKYGHDVHNGVIRLSLLKSAVFPDPNADKGIHEFVYSIYPHAGNWRSAKTPQKAYALNQPLTAVYCEGSNDTGATSYSFAQSDNDNIMIDVLKRCEDGDGYIIRIYEIHGGRALLKLRLNDKSATVLECNLLEAELVEFENKDGIITVPMHPFEIITLKVK